MYEEWKQKPSNQKPIMNPIFNILQAPIPCIASAKADGEFTLVNYRKNMIFTENVWGKVRLEGDLHALFELKDALKANEILSAIFKAELYWEEDGKPTQLPKFISHKDSTRLTLGLFDLVELDGEYIKGTYHGRLELIEKITKPKSLTPLHYKVLPYEVVIDMTKLSNLYGDWLKKGYEGAVITDKGDEIYKLKPQLEIDAVIVGINKKPKLKHNEVTSIKVALIDSSVYENRFIDLTDVASGIEIDLRRELYELMKYKTGEDDETIRVQPIIVATIGYQETYPNIKKPTFIYDAVSKTYHRTNDTNLVSLRSPKLLRFRPDKTANSKDVGLNQLPFDAFTC